MAELDKLLASVEIIMEVMVKDDLVKEVDNLTHFMVKGVEKVGTLMENLDITETGEAESYAAVLAYNKVEGVAQVLVFRNSNLQGKG